MKLHKLFLTALLMLIPTGAFAQDGVYKIIDFNKPSNHAAANILYNYILYKNEPYPPIYNDIKKWGIKSVSAFQVDLNDDGVNEAIGIHGSSLYMGNKGGTLFIIQKTGIKIYRMQDGTPE